MTEQLQSAVPAEQQPAGATGMSEGPDGKMYFHDAEGKQLGLAPENIQNDQSGVEQTPAEKPLFDMSKAQPIDAKPLFDMSKAQPIDAKPLFDMSKSQSATATTAPKKTSDLLTNVFKGALTAATPLGVGNPTAAEAAAKHASDYIYNNVLGKDTYVHTGSADPAPTSAWQQVKNRFWGWMTQEESEKLPGLEPDRVQMLQEGGNDILGRMFGKKEADELREHLLNGSWVVNQPPEVFARAAAKSLTDFYSPGYLALSVFGRVAQGYQKASQAALAAGDAVKAAEAAGKARLLGLLGAGVNLPFAASQAHDLVENWDKMSVAERVAATAGILGAAINTHVGIKQGGGYKQVAADTRDLAGSAVDIAKDAASATASGIGKATDVLQGKATNVVDAMMGTLNVPQKQRPAMKAKVEGVQNEIQAIYNKNKATIEDPATFADAIERHNQENEMAMMNAAGQTRDSAEPVVPDFSQRVGDAIDKFFADNKGRYSDADVAEAKKKILEIILQTRNGQHLQEPNLFEAENARKGLSDESQTAFDPVTKKYAPKNAYQAAATEAARVARTAIDESYHAHGVENVQEFRSKEAPLIDIVKGLRDMQGKAEAKGEPGWFKAAFNTAGAVEGALAVATAALTHSPVGLLVGIPALLANRISQNRTNPIANVNRVGELSNPNARATEVDVRTPPPSTPGGTTPPVAPPTLPTGPTGAPPAGAQTPIVPPSPGGQPTQGPTTYAPINRALQAALSSHYGELVGRSSMSDLQDRFAADIEAKFRTGTPLEPEEKQLLAKINDAHAEAVQATEDAAKKQAEEQKKAQDKAAAEAEKAAKEAEKEKAEKEAAGLNTNVAIPFDTEDEIDLPANYAAKGYTGARVRAHELGHQIMVDHAGHPTGDVISHLHPKIDEGAAAEARWDKSAFKDENGNWDKNKLLKGLPDILSIFYGGPIAEEIVHGIPVEQNPGAKGDLKRIRGILRELDIPPSEIGAYMKAAELKAREVLTTPGVSDIIRRYTNQRQAGLDEGLHMHPETVGAALQEVRNAKGGGGNGNSKTSNSRRVGESGEGSDAGRKSTTANPIKEATQPAGEAGAGAGSEAGGSGGLKTEIKDKEAPKITDIIPTLKEHPEVEKSIKDLGFESVLQKEWMRQHGQKKVAPTEPVGEQKVVLPPERSTGVAEHDAAIKAGGGIPGGVTDLGEFGKIFNYHDPKTGSALGFKEGKEITPETVKAQIQKSREAFGLKAEARVEKEPETIAEHADEFNRLAGKPAVDAKPILHSPEVANRIAQAYEVMPHNPSDPAVQKAYDAAKKDIDSQWNYAQDKMGIKFEPWTKEGQPYANSKEMTADVKNNKHLYFFQGGELPADHPLAAVDEKTGLSYNDKLRAVHDLFGHAAHDFQFGPKGEENAWNVHRQMFSPEAVPALTTETRGQNSWVNFGEHLKNAEGKIPAKGEQGFIPPSERPYAQNKAGLLPEEFHKPNEPEDELKTNIKTKEEEYHPDLQKIIEQGGNLHSDPSRVVEEGAPSFIAPDGKIISLDETHDDAIERATGKSMAEGDNRPGFINDTGAIRTRFRTGRTGETLHVSVPKDGIKLEQVDTLKKAVGAMGTSGNVVLENADRPSNIKTTEKEFASPRDVDSMLREIGAHPEQAAGNWAQNIDLEKQPAGGINPQNPDAPSKRYGFEILPEARKPLEANPTAQDFQDYAKEHGDKLGLHPDIKLGWDTTGPKPELNIGASTNDLNTAKTMAKKLDQRDLWDNQEGKTIPVGGEGKKTAFPEYPIEDRLNDLKTNIKSEPEDFAFGKNVEGTEDQQKGLISTRVPSSAKAAENPLTSDLKIGREALAAVPGMDKKMADLVREYPGMRIPENIKDPQKVLDRFEDHMKENLKALYNAVPKEQREATAKWYDSANKMVSKLAEKFGKSTKQLAGVVAALSPQKDWDQNVSLAERVNDIYHQQQDTVTTPEMMSKAAEIGSRPTGKVFADIGPKLEGKRLSDLTDRDEKAAWIRLFDEAHNPREFQSIDPATGEGRGVVRSGSGDPAKVAWGGLNEIGKAVSILEDGSRENISNNLGDAHKVRNFYNNILDPNNPAGHVTIDTHAVAAALQRMLSGKSTEVLHNFGAGGAPGSIINGVNGTYPLYADAYRAAARDLGIQPRQLQSVVWEQIRRMFPAQMKRIGAKGDAPGIHAKAVDDIWRQYEDRKITLDKAHELVRRYAGTAAEAMAANQKTKGPGKMSAQDFLEAMGQGGLFALAGKK